jgi:hypothetical protein
VTDDTQAPPAGAFLGGVALGGALLTADGRSPGDDPAPVEDRAPDFDDIDVAQLILGTLIAVGHAVDQLAAQLTAVEDRCSRIETFCEDVKAAINNIPAMPFLPKLPKME